MGNLLVLTLIIVSFIIKPLSGQYLNGNIEGSVTDTAGTPVTEINVITRSESLPQTRGTSTDSDGYFRFLSLPIGEYQIILTGVGYNKLIIENVRVNLGKTTYLGRMVLNQKTIEFPEITISGRDQSIDPASAVYGGNLNQEDFNRLPVDRDYKNLTALLPMVNTSFYGDGININGSTGSENKIFIDGMDVTDQTYGLNATILPYNFVREVELITGGYEAEYRGALGGLINVVTRTGSNKFHGSVFGFYTSNNLTAPRRIGLLDPTQGGFSNYDFGFNLNGPVFQDKLWFNAAYNAIFNYMDVDVPGFGISVDKLLTHSFAGKLTWKPSERLNLSLASSGDPNFHSAVGYAPALSGGNPIALENIDPYLIEQRGGGFNYSLKGSYLFSDNIFLESMISRVTRIQDLDPSTEKGKNEIVLINTERGTWSGGSFGNLSVPKSSTTFGASLSIRTGTHIFKTGAEYRDNKVEAFMNYPNALFRFNDSAYVLILNGTEGSVHNRIYSVYLQDNWQIIPGLRINAGIRWDGQNIEGGNGKKVQTVSGPVQPRIGFVFLADKEGRRKLSGSFGRFVQEWHTGVMISAYTGNGYFYEIHFNQDPRSGSIPGDTVINVGAQILPEESNLKAQYYDEITLGFEQMIGTGIKMGVRGIYRTLREAITLGTINGIFRIGNPGKGILSEFPEAAREYKALVLSVEKSGGEHFNFLASYTLSRNYGNYEGLYDYYNRNMVPNVNFTFNEARFLYNSTGLLPSDRTHAFKFAGSYQFDFGLIFGATFSWLTGTPLSELAGTGSFVVQRGTSGRAPSIWDLSTRITYPVSFYGGMQSRLILDIFHIASAREPVDIVQQHYFNVDRDGNPVNINPNYGLPYRYQSPMSLRLGMEVNF